MFEKVLERLLAAMGASDQLISAMGPTFAILLAMVAAGAVAQFLKFPLSRRIRDDMAFSWTVRAVAILATFVFAHFLTDKLVWPLELAFACVQPLLYHVTLAIIRHWMPWLETYKAVGAVEPPRTAEVAKVLREANDEESGT